MQGIRTFNAMHSRVAFPLGGIGTGNVSLGARGDLRDWEIFNQPAKGNILPNSFFAIRAQIEHQVPVVRVLEGPLQPPHTHSQGYAAPTGAGLPRLKGTTFRGEYPYAWIDFDDSALPVRVRLEAYTPLIPLNPHDSGIPCAILTFTATNISDKPVSLALVGSITNPVGGIQYDPNGDHLENRVGRTINEFRNEGDLRGLFMRGTGIPVDSVDYGNLSLVTTHPRVTVKPAWFRGSWFDYLRDFWDDLTNNGVLTNLGYQEPSAKPDTASLGALDTLAPGASRDYRFILTWYFPNRLKSWERDSDQIGRNQYATRFKSAWDVARYVTTNIDRLDHCTRQFHRALFGSTLPPYILDAVSANIVPVRSTTCFWLDDGGFYAWEGCFDDFGCCAGTCTHVWSYAQTVAFLFPSLERQMRSNEFLVETDSDGYMYFRTYRPFGAEFTGWMDAIPEPAVDGQMGSILRVYREWQLSGDRAWLEVVWPGIKRSIDFASRRWDRDQDHVLDGKQHNTYDIEFYGPNPLCGVYYLAALRAVEELAHVMGEVELAHRCQEAFAIGSKRLDELLWNGEYYVQRLDDIDEFPYQHGTGCLSDQLLGQLHACVLGLGDLLPTHHIRAALRSIYAYNFCVDLTDHVNCQRTYALNDEAGLILCTWPKGGRPRFPFPYSDEVWTGIEYQVAAHLIYAGLLDEGFRLVQAVRERHDGIRRNPWNEVECGNHYARAMSSWALLLALSGFRCDIGKGELQFDPVATDADFFQVFWSSGKAWGIYSQHREPQTGQWQPSIEIFGGQLDGVRVIALDEEISTSGRQLRGGDESGDEPRNNLCHPP